MRCETGLYPNGHYCAWTPVEAVQRQANRTMGLPVSACAMHVHQCLDGRTYGLENVPPGTLCQDNRLVNLAEADCWSTQRPSYTPVPTPVPCFHLDDQYICASSESDLAARAAKRATNQTVTDCRDSFYRCVAGVSFPLQPVPAGTKCFQGEFIHDWDDRCTGLAPATSTGSSGSGGNGPPLPANRTCGCNGPVCCEQQCSKVGYLCDAGRMVSAFYASEGTVCYEMDDPWGVHAGFLIHEYDLRCAKASGNHSVSMCPAGETSIRCYSTATAGPAAADACTSKFYQCKDGQPYFIQSVAEGTQCYNGSIVHTSDPVCAVQQTGYVAPSFLVSGALTVRGLDADAADFTVLSTELVLRKTIANLTAVPLVDVAVSDRTSVPGAAGSRVRVLSAVYEGGVLSRSLTAPTARVRGGTPRVAGRVQYQSRVLRTYSATEASSSVAYVPPTDPLPGVEVVPSVASAVGSMGAGISLVNITLGVRSQDLTAALAAQLAWALSADPVTGLSPLTQAMADSGVSVVTSIVGSPVVVRAVAAGATATPSANAGGNSAASAALTPGAIAGIAVGGFALASLAIAAGIFALMRRRVAQGEITAVLAVVQPGGNDARSAAAPRLASRRDGNNGDGGAGGALSPSAAAAAAKSGRGASGKAGRPVLSLNPALDTAAAEAAVPSWPGGQRRSDAGPSPNGSAMSSARDQEKGLSSPTGAARPATPGSPATPGKSRRRRGKKHSQGGAEGLHAAAPADSSTPSAAQLNLNRADSDGSNRTPSAAGVRAGVTASAPLASPAAASSSGAGAMPAEAVSTAAATATAVHGKEAPTAGAPIDVDDVSFAGEGRHAASATDAVAAPAAPKASAPFKKPVTLQSPVLAAANMRAAQALAAAGTQSRDGAAAAAAASPAPQAAAAPPPPARGLGLVSRQQRRLSAASAAGSVIDINVDDDASVLGGAGAGAYMPSAAAASAPVPVLTAVTPVAAAGAPAAARRGAALNGRSASTAGDGGVTPKSSAAPSSMLRSLFSRRGSADAAAARATAAAGVPPAIDAGTADAGDVSSAAASPSASAATPSRVGSTTATGSAIMLGGAGGRRGSTASMASVITDPVLVAAAGLALPAARVSSGGVLAVAAALPRRASGGSSAVTPLASSAASMPAHAAAAPTAAADASAAAAPAPVKGMGKQASLPVADTSRGARVDIVDDVF